MTTRAGLLIIRACVEPGSSSPLRVQVHTTDVSLGIERSEITTDADTAVETVHAWLSEMGDLG